MKANVKWLYAFWRASRALNDPAGRAIAKLDEWALTKLGAHAKEQMSARDWLLYLKGAFATLEEAPGHVGSGYRDIVPRGVLGQHDQVHLRHPERG